MKKLHKFLSIFVIVLSTAFGTALIQNNSTKIDENLNLKSEIRNNEYFIINNFYILNETINTDSFQFWVDIRLSDGTSFWTVANNLFLSSNNIPLDTNLQTQSGSYFLYEVNNLKDNTLCSNFTISLFGYSQVQYVNGFLITQKMSLTAGQISGIIIGVLAALLVIALIILFIVRTKNQDELEDEVIEKNVHNEHHTYVDENGKRFEWVDEE